MQGHIHFGLGMGKHIVFRKESICLNAHIHCQYNRTCCGSRSLKSANATMFNECTTFTFRSVNRAPFLHLFLNFHCFGKGILPSVQYSNILTSSSTTYTVKIILFLQKSLAEQDY